MTWVEITEPVAADYIYKQLIKLEPYESHNSLHMWENRYLWDDVTYRIFTAISQPDYWTLEVLK